MTNAEMHVSKCILAAREAAQLAFYVSVVHDVNPFQNFTTHSGERRYGISCSRHSIKSKRSFIHALLSRASMGEDGVHLNRRWTPWQKMLAAAA